MPTKSLVRRRAPGQPRVASLAADVVPDPREQVTSGFAPTVVMMRLRPLADPGHRRVGGLERSFTAAGDHSPCLTSWLKKPAFQPFP